MSTLTPIKVAMPPRCDGFFERRAAMDLLQGMRTRRACREFTDQAVSRKEMESLIEAAISAPSAMNRQPWAFAALLGTERLHELSTQAHKAALQYLLSDSPLRSHALDPHFELFHGAAALVVVCATDAQSQSSEDCCLAAENLMLAAHAIGLGSCWVGFARPWLSQEEVKRSLGIPAMLHPVAPIVVGHPKRNDQTAARNPPKIVWI
jgi:nitroreductase